MRKMVSRVAAGLVALAVLVTFAPAAWAETEDAGVETVTTDTGAGLDAGLVDLALDGQLLDESDYTVETVTVGEDGSADGSADGSDTGVSDISVDTGEDAGTDVNTGDADGSAAPAEGDAATHEGAAPADDIRDITVHDKYETDSAAVTRLDTGALVTGTAPFDKNPGRGMDTSPDDLTVRSYDQATWDVEYHVDPDTQTDGLVLDYWKQGRVGFEVTLDQPAKYARFDLDSMGWLDRTPGWEPSVQTREQDGRTVQVLTGYRLLEGDSANPYVFPGSGTVKFVVDTLGAPHGLQVGLDCASWAAPSADKAAWQYRAARVQAPRMTVSAKLSLNVRMGFYSYIIRYDHDFNTGTPDAPNRGIGVVPGVRFLVGAEVSMRWPDRSKGLRGLEMPTGTLTYRVKTTAQYRHETNTGKVYPMEEQFQPLFWNNANYFNRAHTNPDWRAFIYPHAGKTQNGRENIKTTTNKFQQQRDATGTTITTTTSGWDEDSGVFPDRHNNTLNTCETNWADASCQVTNAVLHSAHYWFVAPTNTAAGVPVAQHYNSDVTLMLNSNDTALAASTSSGDRLADTDTNSNQAVTNDDKVASNQNLRLPGAWEQIVRYSCGTEGSRTGVNTPDACAKPSAGWSPNGVDGNWALAPTYRNNGGDTLSPGDPFDITVGTHTTYGSDSAKWHAAGLSLVKYDPDIIEYVGHTTTNGNTSIGTHCWFGCPASLRWSDGHLVGPRIAARWLFAVKPDGASWTGVQELKAASLEHLDFYESYEEAARHGVVVAAAFALPYGAGLNNTAMIGYRTVQTAMLNMRVREDARPGSLAVLEANSWGWTRGTMAKYLGVDEYSNDQVFSDALKAQVKATDLIDMVRDNTLKPDHQRIGQYTEAKYDANGVYQGGDTSGEVHGDSLYIRGEKATVGKTVAQTGADGKPKSVYDMDKNERYVDWRLDATVDFPATKTSGVTDVTLTDTLPKGQTYVEGSGVWNGSYQERPGMPGQVTGGTPVEPVVTANKDGSTTLVFTVPNVLLESDKPYPLHYSARIGDTTGQGPDVANNDQHVNRVVVTTRGDKEAPGVTNQKQADATVKISKLSQSALTTRAQDLYHDPDQTMKVVSVAGNQSPNTLANQAFVQLAPANTGAGGASAYHGSVRISEAKATLANAQGLAVWATDSPDVSGLDQAQIGPAMFANWTRVDLKNDGTIALPAGMEVTALGLVVDRIDPHGTLTLDFGLMARDSRAGDAYVSRWLGTRHRVDAIQSVVNRTLDGVAFYDTDGNGARDLGESTLAHVSATVMDRNGNTVTAMDGTPLETVTNKNGYYRFTGVPAGTGYHVVFETTSQAAAWDSLDTTVRRAEGVSSPLNSDAIGVYGRDGELSHAHVPLDEFPQASMMKGAVYQDTWENVGLTGVGTGVMPSSGGNAWWLPLALVAAMGCGVLTIRKRD